MDRCKDLNKPELSMIIPVYQAEKTLKRCVESILGQSYTNYELILVDDGSTDGSGRLCDEFAVLDRRIHVIHKENGGVSSARNAGLEAAQGRYVMFADSDDSYLPGTIELYLSEMIKNDCDILIDGFLRMEKGMLVEKCFLSQSGMMGKEVWNLICKEPELFGYVWNKVFRLEHIRKHQIQFRTNLYSQEDLDFCLSVMKWCNRFYALSYAGYQYFYEKSNRVPPIFDFISNQLKMIYTARECTVLDSEAEKSVRSRIQLLVYVYLYDKMDKSDFFEACSELNEIKGLNSFLKENQRIFDEKSFVTKCFTEKKVGFLYAYYRFRNRIRDAVRKIRKG